MSALQAHHARRRTAVDARILEGATELLCEGGLELCTIERVSERTGVAKTTIYRRYHNSKALAIAAVAGDEQVATVTAATAVEIARAAHRLAKVTPLGRTHAGAKAAAEVICAIAGETVRDVA